MALFVLNTGARDAVCSLRWEWEVRSPELRYSIFMVPKDTVIEVKGKVRGAVKGRKRNRVLVLNRVAQSPDRHRFDDQHSANMGAVAPLFSCRRSARSG
jgi:hypothetical protein